MAYQVLARKWRPRSFSEMAGQGHVLKTLINSLDNNRLHHAYLFTGTRGVGKTTIARILAKCLNCEIGVSSEPCGKCGACSAIDEGRFIDLIEVDAASRTKVEDTRELLDNVQYSPSSGRFKVYLIDEVHMLSGHSFNALLKTLEEPPPHVKFLLATTDPQKLPITVLSRCLQFNLKMISPERLVEHMKFILEQEKISCEEPALWQIGRAAQGSVRDALTLLDQAISYCNNNITDADVRTLLGTIDQTIIHKLVDALIAQDAKGILAVINKAADHAPDFSSVLNDLLSYLHRVSVAQFVPKGIDNSQGDRADVIAHAKAMPAENIQLFYQIGLSGRDELSLVVEERSGIEMILLRMLAFTPQGVHISPDTALLGDLEDSNSEPEKKKLPVEQITEKIDNQIDSTRDELSVPARTHSNITQENKQEIESQSSIQGDTFQQQANSAQDKEELNVDPQSTIHSLQNAEDPALDDSGGRLTSVDETEKHLIKPKFTLSSLLASDWIPLFYDLSLSGITRSVAANCVLKSFNEEQVVLLLDEAQSSVFNDEHRIRMENALSEYFEKPLNLLVEKGEVSGETPATYRKRKQYERIQKAVITFETDENVQEILKRFSGTIQQDSIEALTPKIH